MQHAHLIEEKRNEASKVVIKFRDRVVGRTIATVTVRCEVVSGGIGR